MNKKSGTNKMNILIVASGSGGHIYPALAVAEELQQQNIKIQWLGTQTGMEKKILAERKNIKMHSIAMPPVRGKGLLRWLVLPLVLVYFVVRCLLLIKKLKITHTLCMGGFVTAPAGIATWLLRKVLVLHEQNAVAGFSNRLLAKIATKTFTGFADVKYLANYQHIGNPVRKSIANISPIKTRFASRSGNIRIAIIGGSQGALALNNIVPVSISKTKIAVEIWHQAGKNKTQNTKNIYKGLNLDAKVSDFVSDINQMYEWADLIISRAGAMTISEIIAVGVGAVLVPYPFAVDNHQFYNANSLMDTGGGIRIKQNELAEKLPLLLQDILAVDSKTARAKLQTMAVKSQEHFFNKGENSAHILVSYLTGEL